MMSFTTCAKALKNEILQLFKVFLCFHTVFFFLKKKQKNHKNRQVSKIKSVLKSENPYPIY